MRDGGGGNLEFVRTRTDKINRLYLFIYVGLGIYLRSQNGRIANTPSIFFILAQTTRLEDEGKLVGSEKGVYTLKI